MDLQGPGEITYSSDGRAIDCTPSGAVTGNRFSHLKIWDWESGIYAVGCHSAVFEYVEMFDIANRVDTEDRKNRLKEQIADPLNTVCAEEFPQLDQRLTALEALLREAGVKVDPAAAGPPADLAIDQANQTLVKLEEVLARMQDLETYNELLEIVRDLLKDQEELIKRTDQERKRQAIEELKKLE
jgi:hypothetical protein